MKMVKSLLLGSAAGLVAVAGAQAADLPVKAKPVEYVKVCSVYGAGFYYLPGTDTCLKVGGYVRMDNGFNAGGSHSPYISGANASDTRATADYQTRVRGILSFDARTQTEYGTLRSYIRAGWELNSGDASYRGQDFQYFDRAFIQFAGFTFGKTQSFFGFYNNALNYSTLIGGGQNDTGLNLVAYTAQFGGGFSASIAAEDGQHHRAGLYDATIAGQGATGGFQGLTLNAIPGGASPAYGDYAGNSVPDIVGNIRVDQPWGSAQIAAAGHQIKGLYAGTNVITNPSLGEEYGFAVAAGVKFNLPFAKGDSLWFQATYADGATQYLGFNPFVQGGAGGFFMFRGGPGGGRMGRAGIAYALDGVADPSGISTVEGYALSAAAEHYWTPALRTSVFGHYTKLDYDASATRKFCNGAILNGGATPVGTCNPDFATYQIGSRTIWSPVSNLDIGVEVLYTKLEQNMTAWNLTGVPNRPNGIYTAANTDTLSGTLRFQRNFYP